MTLQELKFLIALADEKHFGKAAKNCFISQPALSVAIRKLEKELGVTFFERDKHEVRITSLGNKIVECAKKVLHEAENLRLLAQRDKDQLLEPFKLGVIYTIGPYLLPPLVTALHQLAPSLPIAIEEDYTTHLRAKLNRGELDAIVISFPFVDSSSVTRILYKEPFVVLMPGHHPLANNEVISEKNLLQYPLLMLGEGHCFRDQVISSCPKCFASSHSPSWRSVAGTSLETIRHMVAANMGLTILPKTAAIHSPYEKQFLTTRPLKSTSPYRIVALAWRKSYPRIKSIEVILQAIAHAQLEGAVLL